MMQRSAMAIVPAGAERLEERKAEGMVVRRIHSSFTGAMSATRQFAIVTGASTGSDWSSQSAALKTISIC
jgi:hypothetical protein